MIIQPLFSIRLRLKNDPNLNAYLMEQYGKPGRFVIGQFKAQNVELDYPFFSFNINGELRDRDDIKREQVLTLYWAVMNSETDPTDSDVYSGVIQIAEIGELIENSLFDSKNPHKGYRLKHEGDTYTDFAINHPYYAAGSQFTVQISLT